MGRSSRFDIVLEMCPSYVDTPSSRFSALDESIVDLTADDAAWAEQLKAITNAADFCRAIIYIQDAHMSIAKFFDPTAPLSTRDGFKGTMYCEAGLASLAYAHNTEHGPPDKHSLWFAQVC